MSQATGLSWLLGEILLSVHIGNFSPVNQDKIQETRLNKMEFGIRDILVWLQYMAKQGTAKNLYI